MEILPHGETHSVMQRTPIFVLSYKGNDKPQIKLNINNLIFKDILVDVGSYTEINLLEEDILKISRIKEAIDTIEILSNSFFLSEIKEKIYTYRNVDINKLEFDTVNITKDSMRLLGLGFFRKFDKVFFDTKKKKIYCY